MPLYLASDLWQYGIRTLNPHQRDQIARFGLRCRGEWRANSPA
jgi:hypothetical protein